MKNNRIVDAWNKIEPDSAADERMLKSILARNRSMGHSEKERVSSIKKPYSWKRFASVAACLVMVIAITAVFGNNAGWFDGTVYVAEVDGGTLNFYRNGAGESKMAFELGIEGTSRNLTEEENYFLFGEAFGNFSVSSHGFFSIGDKYGPDKTLLHVEAMAVDDGGNHLGGMKIIIAASSLNYISDTMIETGRKVSQVNGVEVSAGYWITDENSGGERNIIYHATYVTDGVTVYIECTGSLEQSDDIREEIAFAIDTLTHNGTPNITAITD